MTEPEIQFEIKNMRTEKFENSEIQASIVDSASPSEGPDRAISAFNSSFPTGYFDSLFQEASTVFQNGHGLTITK